MNTGIKVLTFFIIIILIVAGVYTFTHFSDNNSKKSQIKEDKQLELLSWLGEIKNKDDLFEKLSLKKEEGVELIKQQIESQGILINLQEANELFNRYLEAVKNSTTTESILPVGSKLLSIGGKSREGNLVTILSVPEKGEEIVLRTGKDEPVFYHYVNFNGYQVVFAVLKNYGIIGLKEISPLLLIVEKVNSNQLVEKKISKYPTIDSWLRGKAQAGEPFLQKGYQCYQKTFQGWKAVECP